MDAALQLIASLESILRIDEQSGADLADARASAAEAEDVFERFLNQRLSPDPTHPQPDNPARNFLTADRMAASQSRLQKQAGSNIDRETAFMDAFHALMRLYADEKSRGVADQVFQILRELRELGFERTEDIMPLSLPKAGDSKMAKLAAMLEFQKSMKERMARRQAEADRKIARANELLVRALEIARTLGPS
ncbi:MAG TPA: hypothetical protein VG820_10225 [Fimbriimonadaceae bacterium]|nr:hypothetical protein [Fimbriimonadaceae bacterium]